MSQTIAVRAVLADDLTTGYPIYQDGILSIPRIDTSAQVGNFQYATFKYNGQGTWDLLGFKTTNEYPLHKAHIEQVKLVVTDSFPVQVFLNVSGWLSSGCERLGQINQRLVNKRFEVAIQAEDPDLPKGTYTCTANVTFFEKNIPLSVYDLNAGSYDYSVNGGDYIGTFSLTKDNRFAASGIGK